MSKSIQARLWTGWSLPMLLALLATFTFITFPRHSYIINDELSEKAVLSYAQDHGLQFGKDIVFTYGPLGFLTSRYFFPHAASIRMLVDLLWCWLVAAGVCVLAWRMSLLWRSLFVTCFVVLVSNIEPRTDLLIYVGLLCWNPVCFVESGPRLFVGATCFILLGVFGILVKLNFLIPGLSGLLIIVAGLALRRSFLPALGLMSAFPIALVLAWIAAGQSPRNLGPYLASLLPVARGYNQVVLLSALPGVVRSGLLIGFLALMALLFRAGALFRLRFAARKTTDEDLIPNSPVNRASVRFHNLLVLVWMMSLLFVVWKHGFVRADLFHMGFFFGLTPLLVLAAEIAPLPGSLPSNAEAPATSTIQETARLSSAIRHLGGSLSVARILSLLVCLISLSTLAFWFSESFAAMLRRPFTNLWENAQILLKPFEYKRKMLQAMEKEIRQLDLPPDQLNLIGRATVDVFGQDQILAIHNQLNYHPRPVFQSYLAFNSDLNDLNHQFYTSADAPRFVTFRLTPIDHKFPPLEDAEVLKDIIFNYDLVSSESSSLLFKYRTAAPPKLELLRDGALQVPEPINFSAFGTDNIWLEIVVEPTFAGKCRGLAYKIPPVRLAAWFNPGDLRSNPLPGRTPESPGGREGNTKVAWKAPAPMLRAGFLGSPLLLDNRDVVNVLSGGALRRPIAYSVEVDADSVAFWQTQVHYRIYAVRATE